MEGITVTRLSGIDPNVEYRRIDGLGNPGNIPVQRPGNEFAGLGCSCNALNGPCNEGQKAEQLYREFEQRVKNHLINTYNYIVKNRAACGIANPDQVALAYKKIIDNWNDPMARELAMTEAERLIQDDDQIAKDFARKMAIENNMRSAVLVKVRSGKLPKMNARRRGTVVNGLGQIGEVDFEILPESTPYALGSTVADFGSMGMAGTQDSDVTVALGSTMIPYSEVDAIGDDGNDEVYVLQGIDALGRKNQIKIKPKNAINKVKTGVKAVAKAAANTAAKAKEAAQNAGEKAKVAAKKALDKTKELAQKAGKAIVKYNPLFVAGRNGFLLAAKLNIKNIARKLMWGYATLDQAKKAGFTEADWIKSKEGVRKAEDIFVKKAGGQANALRKAVLSSKVAKKAGLGDPATDAALTAATPLIIAIVTALRDVKVAQAGGAPVLDPDGAGGDNFVEGQPTGDSPAPTGNPPAPAPAPGEEEAKKDIDKGSEPKYQNVPAPASASPAAPGNKTVFTEQAQEAPIDLTNNEVAKNVAPTEGGENSGDSGKSNAGLFMGLAAVGIGLFAFGRKKKSVNGLGGTGNKTGRTKVVVEKFTIE